MIFNLIMELLRCAGFMVFGMALTGQTISNFAGALKKDYHGPIIDSLNNMTALYALLNKNEEDVSGESLQAVIPIKTRRNQGIGGRAEGAAIPSARYTKTLQLTAGLAYIYGAIEFSGQTIKASQKNATAFAKVVDMEVNGMVEAIKIDVNRQMCTGTGTGMLCMTNGAGGGATSTVTVDAPGTHYLEEGMPIYSLNAETSGSAVADQDISQGLTEATAHIVKQVLSDTTFMLGDYSDTEITTEKWSTDHYLFRYGSADHEMLGLRGIVDNESLKATSSWFALDTALTTVQGQSRSSYPILDAVISHGSNTNRALTEIIMQDHFDDVEKAAGKQGDKSKMIILTTYGVRKMYVDLLQADRRYVKPLKLEGGWEAITYNNGNNTIPIIVDRHCLPNAMLTLDLKYLDIYRASNFDWMDKDGSMFQRKIDSSGRYDAYEAILYCYMALASKSFKNQGAIRDISES